MSVNRGLNSCEFSYVESASGVIGKLGQVGLKADFRGPFAENRSPVWYPEYARGAIADYRGGEVCRPKRPGYIADSFRVGALRADCAQSRKHGVVQVAIR